MDINLEIEKLEKKELPKRSEKEIQILVESLLKKMTLSEKVGQLYQTFYYSDVITGPMFESDDTIKLIKEGKIGSILNCTKIDTIYSLQKCAVEETRLHIPLLFMLDVIHGYYTSFPTNLGMSMSWDLELAKRTAEIASYECGHSGINLTFSPMIDIVRDSRWGRVNESNGEDPYLSSKFAVAYIEGYQKDSLERLDSIGACVKHYVGYGAVEAGREYNNVDISELMLRQKYLKPFKAAVDANVLSVMTAFNPINGIPMIANEYLVKNVLKDEYGFNGFVISDYNAGEELLCHKIAKDEYEACRRCIEAELDIEMVSRTYLHHLEELCQNEPKYIEKVNKCCARVLKAKYRLGLFDDPYKNIYENPRSYGESQNALSISKKMASESFVMLKNDDILPIKESVKIGLIGNYIHSKDLIGPWGGKHNDEENITIYEGLKKLNKYELIENNDYIEVAKNSNYVIIALGETSHLSGEGGSRSSISLDNKDIKMIHEISEINENIILITFSGRPLVLIDVVDKVKAILSSYYLGMYSGEVLAEAIAGIITPSGKLTMTFPRNVGQLPLSYDAFPTGRPHEGNEEGFRYDTHYVDCPNSPLFPFGYGLSYNRYHYSNFRVNKNQITSLDDKIIVSIDVTNKGNYSSEEIVQLYIEAKSFSVCRPLNELKGFNRVHLEPNETKTITFEVGFDELKAFNYRLKEVMENANYLIKVGSSSINYLENEIIVDIK